MNSEQLKKIAAEAYGDHAAMWNLAYQLSRLADLAEAQSKAAEEAVAPVEAVDDVPATPDLVPAAPPEVV